METKAFSHSGFCFALKGEVLPGLVLTHLVGKDLRTAERLLDGFFLDLMMVAQDRFGDQIQQAPEPFGFMVEGDPKLRQRLKEALREVRSMTYLVTRNPLVEVLIRRLLPSGEDGFQVVDSTEKLRNLPPGGLVLLDALDLSWESPFPFPTGLDHMVVRTLVDAGASQEAEFWLREQFVPIQVHPRYGFGKHQIVAEKALLEVLELARFSRYFERCRSAHLRWRTHLEVDYVPGTLNVQATLCFDGEDRVLRSADLKRDIPWAQIPDLRFSDVLGLQSAKERLQEYLDWLKDPRGEPGIQACVLFGPPGTGKTHACLATAGEAQVPCIVMGGSEFLNQWYGETERIIRETFSAMQLYDAAVLVIDEFDSIAWRRDQSNEWRAQDQAQVVGELLRSVDKLRKGPGRVLLLATTNQYERLDPALVRSMRMGDHLHLGLPSAEDRRAMLQGLLRDLLETAERNEAVAMTTGLSPADLTELVARARKLAARKSETFSFVHLRAAVFERRHGELEGSVRMDQVTKRRVAFHEAGHALVAFHLLGPDRIEHLSVIPAASGTLGTMFQRRSETVDLMDRRTVEHQMAMLLAGRVAEGFSHPETGPSQGAENDLQEATRLAQFAIGAWGLDPEFPLLSMEALPISLQHELSSQFLGRIQHWIQAAEALARVELTRHREQLKALALRLAEAETLHRPDLIAILGAPEATTHEVTS
ncbi:MAG: AAA family ATPase [Holophaga sp.]|nr:AAA family ATPase [Holophaga sp.]